MPSRSFLYGVALGVIGVLLRGMTFGELLVATDAALIAGTGMIAFFRRLVAQTDRRTP